MTTSSELLHEIR